MMSLETWLAYVATVLLLMSTPGPSQLLMLSNSMSHGFQRSLATAAGDLSANAIQIGVAGIGLASVVLASQSTFAVVKWAGVAYLVWMGVQKIRHAHKAGIGGDAARTQVALRRLYWQGFVTSAANPKAVVFFAALFPVFLNPTEALAPQIIILGATYICIDACFLSLYGATSSWIARRLSGALRVWMERSAGGFLIIAALLLAMRRIEPARMGS